MRISGEYTSLNMSYLKQSSKVSVTEKEGENQKDIYHEMEAVSLEYQKITYSFSGMGLPKTTELNALDAEENVAEVSSKTWQDMMDEVNEQIQAFIEKLEELLNIQVKETYDEELESMRAEALESIQDGGEWGADTVSGRILDFAKSISGGIPEKINLLKEAVDKGFEEVKDIFGELPEVSLRTYDMIMEGFDKWQSEESESADLS